MLVLASSPALAQERPARERPRAAVLETQADEAMSGTAGAIDRLVRAQLDALGVVESSAGLALDLAEVQLALGCVGDTAECLTLVADELSVRLLLIPQLERSGDELVLSFALFDREDGSLERAVRRASGERPRAELLDGIDGQLRQLFGLPPPQVLEDPPRAEPSPPPPPPANGPSAGPFVVMGAGALGLAVGAGFGLAFLDAHDEWRNAQPSTPLEIDAAEESFARAEAFAIAADVLFVAGGLAVAGGLTWLLVELLGASHEESGVSFHPLVGPDHAGLTLSGEWR